MPSLQHSCPREVGTRPRHRPPEAAAPGHVDDRRGREQAGRGPLARRAGSRYRLVDPTACERDYAAAERELIEAIQQYKVKSGRMFPTWSEVLEVLQGLGYRKQA